MTCSVTLPYKKYLSYLYICERIEWMCNAYVLTCYTVVYNLSMTKCRITSVNCRGLHDPMKRKDFRYYLKVINHQFIVYKTLTVQNYIKNQFMLSGGNTMIINAGKWDAKGTFTLFELNKVEVFAKLKAMLLYQT